MAADPFPDAGFVLERDPEVVRAVALKHTIATLRRHPDLWRWAGRRDTDSAHEQVADWWLASRAVRAYLFGSNHPGQDIASLLDAAREHLEREDDLLAATWAHVTATAEWAALPRSARDLYAVLHAKARERGRYGGPHVALCHTLALVLIGEATGRRYRSKAVITKAREALIAAGFITAEVGQPWTPGVRSGPTVYDLLPPSLGSELFPLAGHGMVHLPSPANDAQGIVHSPSPAEGDDPQQDDRPRWSSHERYVFESTVEKLRDGRRRMVEEQFRPERPGPGPGPAGLGGLDALLDWPPAEAGRGPVSTWDEIIADLDETDRARAGITGQEAS